MLNYDPDFTCPHERRVSVYGGRGDGGKWVCDPHRIGAQVELRQRRGGNGCLIYSIGSDGDFSFEEAIQAAIGADTPCEIHVFDFGDYGKAAPPNVHYHRWGFTSSKATKPADMPLKSLQETIRVLGHEGMTIDIFKIDCEGCEWETFEDWMEADVNLNQILVEVHKAPQEALSFFNLLQKEGYVTFHKESNMIGGANCVEYAFLRLDKEFSQ